MFDLFILSFMGKHLLTFLALILLLSSCYSTRKSKGGGQTKAISGRTINTNDIALPPGYKIEAIATGLTFPSAAAEDEQGNIYVIQTGYSYGEVWDKPKLLKLGPNGMQTIAEGSKNGPWTGLLYYDKHFYISEGGEMEGGKILKVSRDGKMEALVSNLPSIGDHHTNNAFIKDGYIYFGQGTATNSAVVGTDNADFGWLKRQRDFHDIPCRDIHLAGVNYESDDVFTTGKKTTTGAYVPFGTSTTKGQIIKGKVPCTGSIMRIPLKGGQPELVAWGLRNPYGLALAPNGKMYVTENGYDDRGSRPVWGMGDVLWEIKQDAWYGWPDYSGGLALEGKSVPGKPDVKAVLQQQPGQIPKPVAIFGVHTSANGFDFSTSSAFGHVGEAFVAEFGDMAPNVGKVLAPVGFKVVRVNVSNGVIEDFVVNKGKKNGPASWSQGGGIERPLSVRFSKDGNTMYIVDFGILRMTERGPAPEKETGVVWKVTRK